MSESSDLRGWKQHAYELFEAQAELYHASREQQRGFRAQLAIVLRWLPGGTGRVLDIGCAAGSAVSALRARGFAVVGLDFSPRMLAYAQRRFANNPEVQFCQADCEFLPFPAACFDHITCLGVLEYLPDYGRATAEIARVLRPGGLAVFSIPSRLSLYHLTCGFATAAIGPVWRPVKRLLRRPKAPAAPPTPWHSRNLCVPWRFRRLLRREGLEPVASAYSNFSVFPFDRLWSEMNLRLAAVLECFSDSRLVGWTALQYLVAARKSSK